MQDPPSAERLLEAVAAWLRDTAAPALPPHAAFEARVAANAADIVRRGLAGGPAEAQERARLVALLGREGATDELTRELAERIAAGEMGLDTPGLADHLWRTTLDKVAVDQPKFPLYRRLGAERGGEGA
ncbi:MAG: DUF6285 domain-containing protein [Pseudomonadota bacterium]